jgi:uncharacterized membrane protein
MSSLLTWSTCIIVFGMLGVLAVHERARAVQAAKVAAKSFFGSLPIVLAIVGLTSTARADAPVAHAVLFYDLECSHCERVREQVLPPLQARYGDQLGVTQLEINNDQVYDVFLAALDRFAVPPEMRGVPFLVIGDDFLLGDQDIADQLPGLIEKYLAVGGVGYTAVPGLEVLVAAPPPPGEPVQRAADPVANGLAITIMIGMVAALGYAARAIARSRLTLRSGAPRRMATRLRPSWREWVIPLLAVAGLCVAGYLAYVETTETRAICGPVGDCNAVQSSAYARLFGVLPVGVLGAAGYVAILGTWLWSRIGNDGLSKLALSAVFGLTLFGVAFSLYFTFLEPFVIGAVCAWCLTSAVIMTALLLLTAGPALQHSTGFTKQRSQA